LTSNTSTAKIVIVDHEAIIAADLKSRLAKLGYMVLGSASHPDQALRMIQQHLPDIVITDISLRGDMDGIILAETIRKKWDIPVVFLTAHADADKLARAKLTLPFGYLLKPFRDQDLKITMEMAAYVIETNRKQRRLIHTLLEKEQYLNTILNTTRDGFRVVNAEGKFIDVNDAYVRMSGYGKDQLLTLTISDIDADETPDDIHHGINNTIKTGTVVENEIALESRKARLTYVLEGTNAGTWEWNVQTGQTIFNERWAEIIGYTLDEISPTSIETWIKFVHPEDLEAGTMALEKHFAKETDHYDIECRMKHKSGQWIWVLDRGKVITWTADGKPEWMYGTHLDITERKQAEEVLRISEEKYRLLFEHAPTGIYEVDFTTGKFTRVNALICEYTGYTENELLQMDPLEILTEESQRHFIERIGKINRGEIVPTNPEFCIRNKDGGTRWVQLKVAFVSHDNIITGASVVVHDITERKQAENAIIENQKRIQSLFNAISDPVFLHPLLMEGFAPFVDVNDTACLRYGYTREEFLNLTASDLLPEKAAPTYASPTWRNKIAEAGHFIFESIHITKHGKKFPVEINVTVLEMDGAPMLLAVVRDISERKRMEDEKEKLQQQLQQAHRLEIVGILAGGIAHEFNNLLQAMLGYAQLMMMDKNSVDPDYQKLSAIQHAGDKAAKLVEQLLRFSRKAASNRKPLNLNHEIEKACRLFERRLLSGVIDIELLLGKRLWTVNADPVQIEQILLNLINNAEDAMPDGGKLVVKTENVILDESYVKHNLGAKQGNYVVITVSDTGQGMDRETKQKIFAPFYTTKEIGKGTGLGLAAVYGIVKSHDGYIKCHSDVGQGTTFKVYLPKMERQNLKKRANTEQTNRFA
jgi:two-component system, cell cycle sensor histidine kinase and response regulator CckA